MFESGRILPHLEDRDNFYMRAALAQARKGLGRTSPNPSVGAVIVKESIILARAYHHKAGDDHAEAAALKKAGGDARGATMYVTLEPCDHFGRTPPCTSAILKSSIKRVVIGCKDPNPLVSGRGIDKLEKAGVEVKTGVLEPRCKRIIEAFSTAVTKNRAHVTLKAAVTLDGKIATRTGHSRWISGEESRRLSHGLRNRIDSILVGAGTVRKDDPSLTCRLVRGRDPARVILSNDLNISPHSKVFHAAERKTRPAVIVATPMQINAVESSICARPAEALDVQPELMDRAAALRSVGAEIWSLPSVGEGVSVKALLERLAGVGMNSVLVEGGAGINGAFLNEGLCDRVVFLIAPKILGGGESLSAVGCPGPATMAGAIELREVETKRFGDDMMISGIPDFSGCGVGDDRVMR